MDRKASPRFSLMLVRLASHFVPAAWRREWKREWEGELMGRWDESRSRGRPGLGVRLDLTWRAMGSFVDALRVEGGGMTLNGFSTDLRVAARNLVRRPSFSLVVLATLAVGIGANTAIFALARDVLLRPFPYPEADQVVAVEGFAVDREGFFGNVSYPNMADLGDGAEAFSDVAAIRWWIPALTSDEGAKVLRGGVVTANFFEVLGIGPGLGRFFLPGEEGTGRTPRVVLSHRFWTDEFGGDPEIIGRQLQLNGLGYEVIGVTAADFEDPGIMGGPSTRPALWRTVDSPPTEWPRSGRSWRGIGRVRTGVSLATAQQQTTAVMATLEEAYPDHNADRRLRLVPLKERIAGPSRPVLLTLLSSVGLLLLVACANLANLLLGRALDRRREFEVKKALGATGWRMARGPLAEAFILAVVGGTLGVALAVVLGRGFQSMAPLFLPRPVSGTLDGAVLAFSTALTLGAGLLFGILPALLAARTGDGAPGRDEGRGSTQSRKSHGFQKLLVSGEVAVTVLLLVAAGLLLRSFQRLGQVELGLETTGVVTLELHGSAWWDMEPEAASLQWRTVLEAVGAVPGVRSIGAMDYLPLSGSYSCDGVGRADRPPPPPGEGRCAETRSVLPGTVETLGIPLVRGRLISWDDGIDGPPVVVIDASMAETFWPGEDPLGKPLFVHGNVHEVVGIVQNIRHFGPGSDLRPTIYIPTPQEGWSGPARGLALVVRGGAEPQDLVPAIRRAVWDVNPAIAFAEIRTLEQLRANDLAGPRFRTFLLGAFGLTAVLLAILGISGVMVYSVSRRVREMGIRLAVGAQPEEVRSLILREGFTLTAVGLGVGLVLALALGRFVDALLFEVSARDPLVFLGVGVVVALCGAVASLAPAWRASRVDPTTALSAE